MTILIASVVDRIAANGCHARLWTTTLRAPTIQTLESYRLSKRGDSWEILYQWTWAAMRDVSVFSANLSKLRNREAE